MTTAAAVALSGQAPQPPQPPTFSAANRTVAVFATVMNAVDRLIPDLEREKFEVFDNGKRQELTLFSGDLQPITVVILLDRSGSMRDTFNLVRDAAGSFVDAMLPADKARIGTFSAKVQIDPEDFTSDRGTLVEILRGDLQDPGPTPLWNAVDRGISSLRHQDGRRVILVFTDGVDAPMNFKNGNASKRSVLKRAEEEDVMVYAVGLSGDQGGGPSGTSSGRKQNPFPTPGPPGRGYGGGPMSGGIAPTNGRPFVTGPDPGLKDLATATGGGYFELTSASNLASVFRQVANELHHQYALGFTPAALDGKMHELNVKVSEPNAVVRARKRYFAERPRS